MSIISILELEEKIQINDKTRLNCAKSFVTPDETALTDLTIAAGLDASPISVFSTNVKSRYLDWAYAARTFDIDSTNNKVYFTTKDGPFISTLAGGTYNLSTLCLEFVAAMNAANPGSYSVTFDSREKLTFSKVGSNIAMLGSRGPNNILPHVGFNDDTEFKSSSVGLPIEYGIKKITLTAVNASGTNVSYYYQKVYNVLGDHLYSTDQDLLQHESDVTKYVQDGRSSFLNVHRRAQSLIVEWLDQNGFIDTNGKKFTKFAITDVTEVSAWSKYIALELIFRDFGNAKDDVFKEKADRYEKLAINSRQRAILRLDKDGDGKPDVDSSPDSWTGSLYRK
jgi:hypothetical protein